MEKMVLYIFIGIFYFMNTCFADNAINLQMVEEMPVDTLVGNLATSSGFGVNMTTQEVDNLRYAFLDQTEMQNLFKINEKTGDLKTKVQIDRESVCNFGDTCVLTFDIVIRSITVPSIFSIFTVHVTLDDRNDHYPAFPSTTLNLQILESAKIGASLSIPDATDDDSSPQYSVQSYEIVPENGPFRLDSQAKVDGGFWLNLVLLQALDREQTDTYYLKIVAKDGGTPYNAGTCTVTIEILDDNDNAPVFVQSVYNISIAEGTSQGAAILAVSATDKDIGENGKVIYSFSSRQSGLDSINSLFAINETTGFISVIGNIVYEAGRNFKIFVDASDQGRSPKTSQATVYINILDTGNSEPELRINFLLPGGNGVVNISESTNLASVIASLSIDDPDTGPNGQVTCTISGNFLSLQPITNKKRYLVVISQLFDRETQDYHNVLVTCADQGSPVKSTTKTFAVRVLDDNDCVPQFLSTNYFASVDENNLPGALITKVSAHDDDLSPNNVVQYFLSNDSDGKFSINSVSGVVTANDPLDREIAEVYKFTVLAVDSGNPALTGTASVILTVKDVNDNAPYFDVQFYQFFVEENSDTKNSIGTISALDKDQKGTDNSDILFSVAPGFSVPFIVYPQGNIFATMKLDREQQSSYQFKVVAKDQGSPQMSATIDVRVYVIDDNDNRPNITYPSMVNNTLKIPYSVDIGTFITQVRAHDLDEVGRNSQLTYNITSGNEENVFVMESTTGKIYLRKTIPLTSDKTFPLYIEVSDNGSYKRLKSSAVLKITLLFTNSTVAPFSSENGNRNMIISIVVVALTIVISAAMIAIILILRYKDRRDLIQKPMAYPQITPQTKVSMNGINGNCDIKKKKEVSFSIDDDSENMELCNTSSNDTLSDSEKLNPDKYRISKKGLHVDLSSHKVHQNFDNISELSDEATNSDSGHGSSDIDTTHTTGSHDDRHYIPKSVKLPPLLPSNCPVRADDVLTIITNSNTGNQYDQPRHQGPDHHHKSYSQKHKDKWVPSYV